MKKRVNSNEILQQLLLGKVNLIEVSICADDSSVLIKKDDEVYFEEKNINYNDADLVGIRTYIQDFIKNKGVKILSTSKRGVGIDYNLEVSVRNNPIYFKYTTEGISNKYNRLVIEKISSVSKDYYSARELANKLQVNIMTIYRYIKASKLKAYKIGKEFRIDKKEFNNFLNKVKTK